MESPLHPVHPKPATPLEAPALSAVVGGGSAPWLYTVDLGSREVMQPALPQTVGYIVKIQPLGGGSQVTYLRLVRGFGGWHCSTSFTIASEVYTVTFSTCIHSLFFNISVCFSLICLEAVTIIMLVSLYSKVVANLFQKQQTFSGKR